MNSSTGAKENGPWRAKPSKLSVSRTLGDYQIKKNQKGPIISCEADIFEGKLKEGSQILLMTDGVY